MRLLAAGHTSDRNGLLLGFVLGIGLQHQIANPVRHAQDLDDRDASGIPRSATGITAFGPVQGYGAVLAEALQRMFTR